MSVALLDVNVLIALLWPDHPHRQLANDWFRMNPGRKWATCTITQAGFVRVSRLGSTPTASVERYMDLLQTACATEGHHFWPLDIELKDLRPEIRQRVKGHGQITDAILLELAIRRTGRLVTLDRRIRHLLPADSPYQKSLQVLG